MLDRIAQQKGLSAALIGFAALVISVALSLVQMPQPSVNDEFSYLLAADTFAHGRLSNPTHPLWVHFESLHIIQKPTYASKYPPAQGLMLAAGQVMAGHSIAGVWVSTALACAAIYWMLLAWLPSRWAALGGLLAALHPGMLMWGQSYWGGAVAVTGGALLLGALRRVVRRPQVRVVAVMGAGLAILANSRPFEGLLLSLPVAGALLAWMAGRSALAAPVVIGRIVLPILMVLALTAGAMGYYNLRVTGSALRMPYLVHEAQYALAPQFLWQRPWPEPMYRHKVMRDFYVRLELPTYTLQRSPSGFVRATLLKIRSLWQFYLGVALTVPLVMLPWVLRDRWMQFALVTCGVFMAGLLGERWPFPQYAAPLTGLVFALVVQSIRHLHLWRWRGRPTGQSLARAVLAIYAASVLLSLAQFRVDPNSWSQRRAAIVAELEKKEGCHLVVVRYGPEHWPDHEWVYNMADIDGSKVVWAREVDPSQNQKLLAYFRGRRVWLVEADAWPPSLTPYPVGSSS